MSMTLKQFESLSLQDFENGAVRDEIAAVFKERDELASPVSKITFFYQLAYHEEPFVHGVRNSKDVWLRDDGMWTEDEDDERIGLAVSLSFYPKRGNWHGDD